MRLAAAMLVICSLAQGAEDPHLEFALGVLAECRDETEASAVHFEKARALDPTAAPLVEISSRLRLKAGDRSGAIALQRELAAARPDDLAIQFRYADLLTTEGKNDALAQKNAIQTLEAALVRHPAHPEIIRRLCAIYHERGELQRAKQLSMLLEPGDPESTLLFANLSRTLNDADDEAARKEVARRFELAFAAHPDDPALARAASEFHRPKNRDQAIKILQQHVAAAPWSLKHRARLGILLFSVDRDSEGLDTLMELLAIHPRHAQAHESLAKFHRLHDDPQKASHHAGEALKIQGGAPSEFLKLADEHLAAERPREARLLLEKAVFDHPDHAGLRMKLAIASQADPESRARAARLFREAEAALAEGQSADPAFLTASAESLIQAGQSKAAEERLRAAIRLYPPEAKKETAATLRRLASLWETENRNVQAARALRSRADSLDP